MDIKEKTNELLQELLTSLNVPFQIRIKAQEILDDKFKDEVRDKFKYYLEGSKYDCEHRKIIKEGTKCAFIEHFYAYYTFKDFLNKNYDKIDKIINILKEYVKELEEENKTED